MPHELSFMGVYFSPFVLVTFVGILGATMVFVLLIRSGVIGYFANPPWVFLSLCVLCISVVSWWTEVL